jgi:hypothetical protein
VATPAFICDTSSPLLFILSLLLCSPNATLARDDLSRVRIQLLALDLCFCSLDMRGISAAQQAKTEKEATSDAKCLKHS